ncbi:hypothetical protein [Streptomyces sp. NBC_00209]|uniref:hypothetical protein n=1 Tax=Streptomyces sp. NBC_00209 TaxID=2975682 RepID=UPI00324D62FC
MDNAAAGRCGPVAASSGEACCSALVADQLLSRGAGRLYADAETGDEIIRGLDLVAATDALDLVAAVLAILVVRRVTAMQSRRAELGAFPAGPRPLRAH